jgi:hypothetical protein
MVDGKRAHSTRLAPGCRRLLIAADTACQSVDASDISLTSTVQDGPLLVELPISFLDSSS